MWRPMLKTMTLKGSNFHYTLTWYCQCAILLDKDGALLLVIKETKAMASAKCDQLPL